MASPQRNLTQHLAHLQPLLGDEYGAFLASYNHPPVRGIRWNTLKMQDRGATRPTSPGRDKSLHPIPETRMRVSNNGGQGGLAPLVGGSGANSPREIIPWCPTGEYIDETERPSKTIAYHQGLFYIQEPSAMLPVEMLAPLPGERVLDLCAAPGGKSVQIAGHLRGAGLLVANDASASRSRALVANIERAGVTNAIVLTEQPHKLAARFPEFFDAILVDAPCSGEGMFRRDAATIAAWSTNKPHACAAVQAEILRHAACLLRPGGRLVYSTCTFNRTENEDVIENFLQTHPDFSLIRTRRIWPHTHMGEGHFAALIQKQDRGDYASPHPAQGTKSLDPNFAKSACADFVLRFFEESLRETFLQKSFSQGLHFYKQPFPVDLSGLRVARSGWYLGDEKNGRFTPSQAFAMGVRPQAARFSHSLDEASAWRYLRGESLFSDINADDKPYVLVTHGGHALGWARLVGGRLKNALPPGWTAR